MKTSVLSNIVAGCMSWGNWGKQLSTQEMITQMHLFLEADINTFDHADIYGDYTTEAEFGKAFTKSHINREDIRLISKCGIQYVGKARNNKIKHYEYSKEYIIKSVEQSLENLQTDYLDVLLLHRPSPLMQPDEINEAITMLQKEGKIKQFGVSNFSVLQTDLISSKIEVEINQIEFSLTQCSAMFDGNLDRMIAKGIQPMSWSPLGTFFKENNEQTKRIKKVLEKQAEKYNATEDTILLAWILKHPARIIPVIGTTNKQRILNTKKALEIALETEDWFELLEASRGHKVL